MTKDYANMLCGNGPDWQSAADAEWLAAIRKQDHECIHSTHAAISAAIGDGSHTCAGCAPLRALIKRAMETTREAL